MKGNYFAQMNGVPLEIAKGPEKYQVDWLYPLFIEYFISQ